MQALQASSPEKEQEIQPYIVEQSSQQELFPAVYVYPGKHSSQLYPDVHFIQLAVHGSQVLVAVKYFPSAQLKHSVAEVQVKHNEGTQASATDDPPS